MVPSKYTLLSTLIALVTVSTPTFGQLVDQFTVDVMHSEPHALSRNGKYVVGGGDAPWVWSRDSGVSVLEGRFEDLNGRSGDVEHAFAISDDGLRIVGDGQVTPRCDDDREVFLYKEGAWSSGIGDDSSFGGLSADGAFVGINAYAYTDEDCPGGTGAYESSVGVRGDLVDVFPTPDELTRAEIVGVSANGGTLVGNAVRAVTPEGNWIKQAVIWDGPTTPTTLPLPADADEIRATAISGDGMVVNGVVKYANHSNGFRWTRDAGMEIFELPFLPRDVSYDGTIVVGGSEGTQAIWLDERGPIPLSNYLSEFGLQDDPWFRFVDMSDDGRTFLGTTSDNQIVVVSVPEPSTALLLSLAAIVTVSITRRKRF